MNAANNSMSSASGSVLFDAVNRIVRRVRELTARRLVAFLRKEIVADAHLDVVRLAGEHQQGFVLRLPAEPRDRPIVAASIRKSGDPKRGFSRGIRGLIRENRSVRDGLDQARAEYGRRDSQRNIPVPKLIVKVLLRDATTWRVRAPSETRKGSARPRPAHWSDRPRRRLET